MLKSIFALLLAATISKLTDAECANACNGHGKCTSYDMCLCNRNWQANDCSERVCQFGLAHVDTPKGDLDMSGTVTGAGVVVVENNFNYPYGTTEQFPAMQDSDLAPLTNTAHYYMECSNKGTCDRSSGDCTCFDGYDGAACQRASCPGYPASCSGHGVCKTIQQLADADNQNIYELWDKKATMGCECDSGYYGPDCSLRQCKYGVDPLYLDDSATIKYSIFDFAVLSTDSGPASGTAGQAVRTDTFFSDGMATQKAGYWAIRFFDAQGEDWLTEPIVAGASCKTIVAALEALPNNVIPPGQTWCSVAEDINQDPLTASDGTNPPTTYYNGNHWITEIDEQSLLDPYPSHQYVIKYKMTFWDAYTQNWVNTAHADLYSTTGKYGLPSSYDASSTPVSGFVYRIKFFGNPGKLREPEIELYLDGKRPSLQTKPNEVVITKVWTDGQQGENVDYFADHCDGVTVTIDTANQKLSGLTAAEALLLKSCLSDSDFDTSNNRDLQNWDYGNEIFPHLIKLVRSVTTFTDGGYYAAIYYDGSNFKLVNPFTPPDSYATDLYEVYTTKGTLALTSNYTEAAFDFGSKNILLSNTQSSAYDINPGSPFSGGISCETETNLKYRSSQIVDSTSIVNTETRYIQHCLNKTDLFVLLNWNKPESNPPNINIYTAQKLFTKHFDWSVSQVYGTGNPGSTDSNEATVGTHVLVSDLSTNWAAAFRTAQDNLHAVFRVYKFFPAPESSYEYAAQCSNRGICATDTGVCQCFPGYSSDSCHEQNSLAV